MRNTLLATGLLAGTIIGAGIFGLPYVFTKLGMWLGAVYLIAFAFVYFLVHFRYAEVLHENRRGHHFFYFAKKYFKPPLARFASWAILGELVFVMTVYLILASSFANLAFNSLGVASVLVFWILGSLLIFAKSSLIGFAELIGIAGVLIITSFIVVLGGGGGTALPSLGSVDVATLLLPFGIFLFAFGARPAIPKVYELYRSIKKRKKIALKWVILWGTLLPVLLYLIFVVSVLRLVPNVSPDTVSSLSFLPASVTTLVGLLGLLALWTSYFVIGSNLFDILRTDVTRSRVKSGVVAVFAPLVLYLIGVQNFLVAVSITGGVFLALEAIFVNMMWVASAPRPRAVLRTVPLYVIFAFGAIYEIVRFVF